MTDNIDKKDYSIRVACEGDSALARELAARNVPTLPIDISSAVRPWSDAVSAIRLNAMLDRYKPDILHVHGMRAWQVAAALPHKIPIVASVHNFPYRTGRLTNISYKLLSARTSKIITVSYALAEYLCSCGISQDKIAVIYNGIDLTSYGNYDNQQNGGQNLIIGTVSRLIPQKGIDVLLEAFRIVLRKYHQARLLIAGDGPSRIELERLCWQMGIIDKVVFLGYIDDIESFMNGLDIFVLPSLSEGFGISVLEAMACAKPVIASSVGGISEIIEHGRTGFLFPPGDSDALAMYLGYIAEHADDALDIARAARLHLDGRFDARTMAKKIEGIYRGLT